MNCWKLWECDIVVQVQVRIVVLNHLLLHHEGLDLEVVELVVGCQFLLDEVLVQVCCRVGLVLEWEA